MMKLLQKATGKTVLTIIQLVANDCLLVNKSYSPRCPPQMDEQVHANLIVELRQNGKEQVLM